MQMKNMSQTKSDVQMDSEEKKANDQETDLGSAASSANSSGDEEESEDDDEDVEISFKTRRTTRSSSARNSKAKTKKKEVKIPQNKKIRRGSPLQRSRKSSISCSLCNESVEDLSRHLSLSHFKSKLSKLLPSLPPFKCPKCSAHEENRDNLICHYGGHHKLNDRYLTEELKSQLSNGTARNGSPKPSKRTTRRSSSTDQDHLEHFKPISSTNGDKSETSEDTKPPKAWLISKPKTYGQYTGQIKSILRLTDGRTAAALDDRRIKCVCDKVIKVNFKYNWRFLIQKPLLSDGKIIPKGHWFLCSEVNKVGSEVEDWKISKAEIEASKAPKAGCDLSPSKRTSRKRGLENSENLSEVKRVYQELSEPEDESEDETDFEDEEETLRDKRMIIKTRVTELLRSRVPGEIFIQDGPCFTMSSEGSLMCHECKYMPIAEKRAMLSMEASHSEISCCFYSFRKLRCTKMGGSLQVAGYLDPYKDAMEGQMSIWKNSLSEPVFQDQEKAKFILSLIGDQFCDMVQSEQKCLSMHYEIAENKTIVWKPTVKGVREMCDTCKTTIFNHHWTCGRCGVYICLDCYRFRKEGMIKEKDRDTDLERDEYNWPLCTTGESHQIRKLLLAQIIPKNNLVELANKVHQLRRELGLNQLCHPKDFADAYSLAKLAENKSRANTSPNISGRPSLMYACRLCPETAFKWQSCLYKHFLINHFNEEIRSMLPNEAPFKCPKCDYTVKQKHLLMLHFGITHKIVLRLIEQKFSNQDNLTKTVKGTLPTTPHLTQENPSENSQLAFDCPLCPLKISPGLRKHHLTKHFYAQLSSEVKIHEAPYSCHLCRHISISRQNLIKHVGIFHGLVDQYVKHYLPSSLVASKFAPLAEAESLIEAESVSNGNVECRLCDRPQFFRHNGELYRHLSLAHFSQQIWKDHVRDKDQRPFKCDNCEYINGSSTQLIIHIGVVHRMAIKYHFEVLNIKETNWSNVDPVNSATPRKLAQPSNQPLVQKRPNLPKLEKCPVCDTNQAFPALLFHLAQHHFSQLLAASRVPVEAPFKCPLCPYFAENYGGMLKHYLLFHKQLESMTEHVKNPEGQNFVPAKAEESKPLIIRQDFAQRGPFHCLLCDDLPTIGQTSYDFHKHLCEHHFRERLLAVILPIESKESSTTESRKYGCPVPNCGYELPQKWVMAKHYGLKHQVAKQLYAKICNLENMPPAELQMQLQHTAKALPMIAGPIQAEEEDDLNDTFDDDSFDENEALKRINSQFSNNQQYSAPPQIHPEAYPLMTSELPYQAQLPTVPLPTTSPTKSELNSSFEESLPGTHLDMAHEKNYDCKICAVKSRGMSEYLKHLSKVHFKHKLLSMVPKTPPYKCPWSGCEVVKKDRYNISLHYGMTHKMALKLMQEMPEDAINEEVEAVCKLCHQSFTAHRYLYTHLSDAHFQAELDQDLPTAAPWKCPKCPYLGNDPRALRVHYGVRHKVVLNHLASRLGINANSLKKEMKAGRKKAVSALKGSAINCRFCTMQFKSPADHAKHTVMHLRHVLNLPTGQPWKCPRCEYVANQHADLVQHYGEYHSDVLRELLSGDVSKLNIDMSFLPPPQNPHQPQLPQQPLPINRISEESQRQILEDKRFPKCRLCNYRYFTRLDLCRHFVDFHLRSRLHSCLDPNSTRCPACALTYEKKQSRLRHFIWSHQDLEGLVVQDSQVRLSEFMPSLRDLEIVKQKNQMRQGEETQTDFKDITDLAALPVNDTIDVKLQNPYCELCGEEFKNSVNKARDKSAHLLSHFREDIMKDLPSQRPFKCPKCTFLGRDSIDLLRHYGLNHRAVFIAMQRELGDSWSLGDSEDNDCKICRQVFLNSRALNDHYCAQHFFAKIAEGLPTIAPFKCPSCSFAPKTQLALVRHMGNKHKLVKKFLVEQGLEKPEILERRMSTASQASQDSGHFDQYYQQMPQQNQQWVEHYNYSQPQYQQAPVTQQQQPFASPSHPTTPGFASPHHPMQSPQQHDLQIQQSQDYHQQHQQQAPMLPTQPAKIEQKVTTRSDQTPVACPICSSTFLNGTHFLRHAADKHFVERLKCDLPQAPPFSCPVCNQNCKDLKLLIRHYGLNHKMVLKFLNERNGLVDCYDDAILKQYETQESNRDCCPLCKSSFGGRYMLLRHLADCHFRERLCQGLPQGGVDVYKCPECNHESKDKGGFVRHYGLVHKKIQTWLKEMGIQGFDDTDQTKKQISKQPQAQIQQQPPIQAPVQQVHHQPQVHQQYHYNYQEYPQTPQAVVQHQQPPQPVVQHPQPPQTVVQHQQPPQAVQQPQVVLQQQQPVQAVQQQQPPIANQYYSSPPGSYNDQYSPRSAQHSQQQPQRPYSTQLLSPSSQSSPQNLSTENYISPQGTPQNSYGGQTQQAQQAQQQPHYDRQYYSQQPQDLSRVSQQPLDYSNGAYFNHPNAIPATSQAYVQGGPQQQQPQTPQTPNPSVTPQPMTPGSHGAPTPQPMTPQDQNSNSSTGLMSPGGYNYEARTPTNFYMQQQPQQQFTPPQQQQQFQQTPPKPVTLQAHDSSPTPNSNVSNTNRSQSSYVPVGDEYIESPAPGIKGPFAIQCMYCNGVSKNKSDFYRHLSERHFKAELAKELPTIAPFRCPMANCQYETKDNSVGPLIKHYGIVHKSVQKYLQGQVAGRYVHNEAKAAKQASSAPVHLELKPSSSTTGQPVINGHEAEQTTMSNLALKVKCPFCDLMFAARYTFHQHLCDRHFKETLAERVPSQPPYLCPVGGCGYVAKDSRQSLVRHYGMTHKVIVELLKNHAPEYNDDPFNSDTQHLPPPPPQPLPQQPQEVQYYPQQQAVQQVEQQYQGYYHHEQYSYQQQQLPAMHFEPQIDGTFDPSHYSDQSSLDGFKSLPTTPIKQEIIEPTAPSVPSTPKPSTSSRSGPKVCEICGKQFEGKNRAMLKVQHMAQHFKDKLFADLIDKSPPFRCPVEGCQYQTKHKPDWARHYGSVHQLIAKYLKEYLETHEPKTEPSSSDEPVMENDDEKTYSAYLPKAELSQIISTAMDQQSQPQRNFGVITISAQSGLNNGGSGNDLHQQAEVKAETATDEQLEPQQCFICPNGPWFQNEKELNDHLSTQHIEFVQELKPRLEVLDDLGEVLNDLDIEQTVSNNSGQIPGKINAARSTGRPCELCGFEPKTKNKSRERQDHLAMKHYRERIQADLTASTNFSCPLCDYVGKDKQTIYRHYTGKHKVVEQYLAEDIAAGRVETLAQKQAKEAAIESVASSAAAAAVEPEMKTLPSFEATTMELQNPGTAGLDLSLHGLVDPDTGHRISLTEFLDGNEAETGTITSSGSTSSDRIMQVDGMISNIMQVDGFDDDADELINDLMPFNHPSPKESSSPNSSNSPSKVPQIDSKCPICNFPTKLHKTYHLATKHFKDRLMATLPREKPFKCPDCNEYEAKTRINLWTHYLGKHQYSKKWTDELLGRAAPMIAAAPTSRLQSILERPTTYQKEEVKVEVKTEPGSSLVTLPTPTLAIEEIIKAEMIKPENEIKSEPLSEANTSVTQPNNTSAQMSTPVTSRKTYNENQKTKIEFWCDLCQRPVKFVAKSTHFATVHFEAKLKATLPTSEPFLCVMCTHVGKDFNKLTSHFLNRHDILDEWIQEELEILEDDAIAKSTFPQFMPKIEDLEEVDSDIENEPPPKNEPLRNLFSKMYPDLESPCRKRRKVSKSIRDKGLQGIKDIIDSTTDNLNGVFRQKMPKSREPIPVRIMTTSMTSSMYPNVPAEWFCDGKLLMLTDPSHEGNVSLFQDQWIRGQPVVVANVHKKLDMSLWRPSAFSREFGHIKHDVVNTKTGRTVPEVLLSKFWDGFENLGLRMTDENGLPMLLKLKDWPPDNDLAHTLPSRFDDLMKCIPLKEYTRREGRYNLASFMPDFFARPDLGPKMYIAYGNALYPNTGTTNLHIDMSDACNLLVHVSIPGDGIRQDHISEGLKSLEEADCDPVYKSRIRTNDPVIGAIWHIYHPRDADKIRDMLNKLALEKGQKLEPNTDPIHDQCFYLDANLRKRLYKEYNVVGYAFPQCEGDVVFIPAGAPHQVRNIHNCIKIAEDFVSPENLEWCFYQTEEFRHLSETHTNHEDKLQIKNILYHSVKECVNLLEKKKLLQ